MAFDRAYVNTQLVSESVDNDTTEQTLIFIVDTDTKQAVARCKDGSEALSIVNALNGV